MQVNYKKEIVIDKRSNSNVSEQIVQQFQSLLTKSRISHGEEIINHEDLAELLGVDEEKVLNAYERLENYNFIIRNEDKVYYSKQSRVIEMFSKYSLVIDNIKSMGKEPSIDTLAYEIVTIEDEDSLIDLNRYKDKRFLKQARLFKADGEPYIYFIEYFPVERFPELADDDNHYVGRVFEDYLRKEYDLHIYKNQRFINVINYDLELSQLFKVQKGLPGFKVGLIFYDEKMLPINYGYAYSLPYLSFESDVNL